MALSPETANLLSTLFGATQTMADALSHFQLSVEQGATDNRVAAARDALMALFNASGVDKLIAASQEMQAEHASLLQKRPLTDDDYLMLGLLSAGSVIVGAQALKQASSPMSIFVYTMKTIWNWIKTMGGLIKH
jgi:hypothetical protein